MEAVSAFITTIFFALSPALRLVMIFLFSYGEGLPVIGSILPGGTVALLVGSLSAQGYIVPGTAAVIIAFGSFLGDITGFFIGKKLKNYRWLQKLVANEKHEAKWDVFDRHLALIIIFGKLVPVVRSTPSFFAGARNIKTQKYFLFSFLGSLLWAFVGVYGGNLLAHVAGNAAIPIIIGILIVTGVIAFTRNHYKNRKKSVKKTD